MFSLRKRTKTASRVPRTGIRETVAGITGQIDQLVAIARDVSAPTSDRVTACEVVRSIVEFQSLSSVTEIWYAIRDITDLENPAEVRRAGWRLAQSCIDHDEVNNSAFTSYYASIVRNSNIEDFDLVLSCLECLTNQGRKVVGSQAPRQLPRVLLEWAQMLAIRCQETRSNPVAPDITKQWGFSSEDAFLRILGYIINVLKFNMSIWDPMEIEKLLLVTVAIVRNTSQITDCQLSCVLIDSVIAFGLMPVPVLQPVLEILCGMATMVPSLKEKCVAIVQKLAKSHLQNSTITRLCRILDSPTTEVTQSMRIAAATQLKDFLLLEGGSSQSTDPSAGKPSPLVTALNAVTASGSRVGPPVTVLDDSSASQNAPSLVDVSIPVLEVLEAYERTLLDPQTPLRLVLTLLDCFTELLTKFELLTRLHASSWLWPNETTNGDPSVSPADIILQLSKLYGQYSEDSEQKEEVNIYREKMSKLGTALIDMLLHKSLSLSFHSHIMTCIRISHFLDTDSCDKLLTAIESLQFCTPGVDGWFENLTEVMNKIYLERTDRCRAHVLDIVKDVYLLDAEYEDWISSENLVWVTELTFSCIEAADESTLENLMNLYEHHIFYSNPETFERATQQLSNAAASPISQDSTSPMDAHDRNFNRVKSVDALTLAFGKAYRLYPRQAKSVLDGLISICQRTFDDPDIFAKAWAVLCRIRSDRWDRLLIVNHRIEENYNQELNKMQESLPAQLESIHAVPSLVIKIKTKPEGSGDEAVQDRTFDTLPILQIMLKALQSDLSSERTLVLIIINAASQLAHFRVLCESDLASKLPYLQSFRDELENMVATGGTKIPQAAMPSPARRSALLCVVIHILSVLFPFRPLFPKSEHDRLVYTLVTALGRWNLSTGWVVHCFTLACYEAPSSVQRYLPQILSRLQLKITGRDSAMFILDFLLSLSLEGSLTKNFTHQDFKRVFGMCFSFIQNANDLLALRYQSDISAQWLLRLAYAAISNLFLSMRLENRRSLVPYLMRNLALVTRNPSQIDPMSLVVYDMINRFAYSDVPLRTHLETVPQQEPGWEVKRWMRGVAIFEIRCNRRTGEAVRIVRRPAGIFTTFMTPATSSESGPNLDPLDPEVVESGGGNYTANFYFLCGQLGLATFQFNEPRQSNFEILQNSGTHMAKSAPKNSPTPISNLSSSDLSVTPSGQDHIASSIASVSVNSSNLSSLAVETEPSSKTNGDTNQESKWKTKRESMGNIVPLVIPDDAASNRAVASLDRVPIVDLYKVGIIYCAPGQNKESEILANSSGSLAYRKFLERIGVLIRLKQNRTYYVGGLDTEQDLDGQYALAWSSKISQIIFHTITMMPNYENDVQFASKKRHIGNNFVNIYFDESGEDFEFDIVKSQFNFINIVITPSYTEALDRQRYWKVRAYRKPGMKNTLAAYEVKVVSEDNLALFVRNLAFKASQYAAIHSQGAEFMDNWVYRLQLISTLRERIIHANASAVQKQARSEEDSEESKPGSEGDFIIPDDGCEPQNSSDDIKLLTWMDFTRFTI